MFIFSKTSESTGVGFFTLNGKKIDRELFEFLAKTIAFEDVQDDVKDGERQILYQTSVLDMSVAEARAKFKEAGQAERIQAGIARQAAYVRLQRMRKHLRELRTALLELGMDRESIELAVSMLTDEQQKLFAEIA